MYRITNKDRNELINLLSIQIEGYRALTKEKRLTGRDRTIMSKALYLEYRLSKLKKV